MGTLLQGVFVEAEGARGLLVGAMPVNSQSGSGAMRPPGSQDQGGKRPLAHLHLHADPLAEKAFCSRAAGRNSNKGLAVTSKGFAPNPCEGVTFHQKLTPTF